MAGGQEAADRAAESFQGVLLRYRGRTGLTQRELAARVGVSTRTVENCEAGVNYPSALPLQALILVLLESGGLTVAREGVEAHELWAAALRQAPRMHTPLDEVWLAAVLAERTVPQTPEQARKVIPAQPALSAADVGGVERLQDWGEALRRRSLVERAGTGGMAAFTLQSVVLEYVTDRLVEEVVHEVERAQPLKLVEQPLVKAQAKDYVRQRQERLIGAPILQLLTARYGKDGTEQRLLALLDLWRNGREAEQGYGPGNVVNLLRLLRGDLHSLDLGRLAIRQAHMAGIEAQDASLAAAHLSEAVLAEAFHFSMCVALSGDGGSVVAGTAAGEVWLWRVADRTALLAVQGHTGLVHSVALSADGRLLASGGEDGRVRLHAARAGNVCKQHAAVDGRRDAVHSGQREEPAEPRRPSFHAVRHWIVLTAP